MLQAKLAVVLQAKLATQVVGLVVDRSNSIVVRPIGQLAILRV